MKVKVKNIVYHGLDNKNARVRRSFIIEIDDSLAQDDLEYWAVDKISDITGFFVNSCKVIPIKEAEE